MKIEIKNAILEMLSEDATITELRDTAEDFTWVFDYVKTNAEQLRTRFKTESYNSTVTKAFSTPRKRIIA